MSEKPPMRVAIITAGAAGMYCGSCMRDNTLAKALCRLGTDARLIPTYTPIRTDEENVSVDQVFFGGINIFLQEKIPLFRLLPKLFDQVLDRPGLIRWVTKRATSTDAKKLGGLTVSMLQGTAGHQRKEVRRLCEWMSEFRPDLINFSNVLIAGCIPELRRQLNVPMLVTLQGDDIFLDELTDEHRQRAFAEIRKLDQDIDGYIVFSNFYADYMSSYLGIDRAKFVIAPLGIEVDDLANSPDRVDTAESPLDEITVGYLARIAPEKGFHLLVDAFIQLHQRHGLTNARLATAGWLGDHRKEYLGEQTAKLKAAGLSEKHKHHGELSRKQKIDFLRSVDIVSVPTTYREPKGIYVLESLACGVPVIQPDHGAFPELLASTDGGIICEPHSADALADALAKLIRDHDQRRTLGQTGKQNVLVKHSSETMARETTAVFQRFIDSHNGKPQ